VRRRLWAQRRRLWAPHARLARFFVAVRALRLAAPTQPASDACAQHEALDDALGFVAEVKLRFQARMQRSALTRGARANPRSFLHLRKAHPPSAPQREPRTYAAFLALLAAYRADQAGAVETHAAVARLFRRTHADLAAAFARFLPADVAPTR